MNVAARESLKDDSGKVNLDLITRIVKSKKAVELTTMISSLETIAPQDFNFLASHLFFNFTYSNLQRAGAALNMTVGEARNAKTVTDDDGNTFIRVLVRTHKTSGTYGPASVFLTDSVIPTFNCYIKEREDTDDKEEFLIRHNGASFKKHYVRFIKEYTSRIGINDHHLRSLESQGLLRQGRNYRIWRWSRCPDRWGIACPHLSVITALNLLVRRH